MPGPLLNEAAIIQCMHGGVFPVKARGPRPLLTGIPALAVPDFPGVVAIGCVFNVAGAPAPCVIISVVQGICPRILHYGAPAVDQTCICATTNGPSMPVQNPGQLISHSV